jgi:hypothetical protein
MKCKQNKVTENLQDLQASPVPGMPGYYVNKDGIVFSVIRLEPFVDSDGYARVNAFINGKRKKPGVHSLLARTFLTKESNHVLVRHLDGNPSNNNLNNLAWGTVQENGKDMAKHGSVKGSNNPKSILTEQNVKEIRMRLANNESQKSIARDYVVSSSTIQAINSNQNWSWLK